MNSIEIVSTIKPREVLEGSDGRPWAKWSINGKIVECLLDTGAAISCMSYLGWKSVGSPCLTESKMRVKAALGRVSEKCAGECVLKIENGISVVKIKFIVMNQLNPDIIIGNKDMIQLKFALQSIAPINYPEEIYDRTHDSNVIITKLGIEEYKLTSVVKKFSNWECKML